MLSDVIGGGGARCDAVHHADARMMPVDFDIDKVLEQSRTIHVYVPYAHATHSIRAAQAEEIGVAADCDDLMR